ncbi:GNAT family N-acetyltransferase [Calidifontibacter terrae]
MPSEPAPLHAAGRRVRVATPTVDDIEPYRRAVEASRDRVGVWNPVNPGDLIGLIGRQDDHFRTFLIRAYDAVGNHDVVGKVNVFNIVQGRFWSGTMGYDSYDPYAGAGLFAEGMRLIIDLCFQPRPYGLGLHRLEANVQPRNTTSAGLLRSLGFRRERHVKRMLFLDGGGEPESWRDHESFALTADERPIAYGPNGFPRVVVLVNGLPGSGKSSIAGRIAGELGVPVWSKDAVKETLYDSVDDSLRAAFTSTGPGASIGRGASQLLWRLLADSPTGGVIDNNFRQSDLPFVVAGLRRAGIEPDQVLQVWCDVPPALARDRSLARRAGGKRHPIHGSDDAERAMWEALTDADTRPLALGQVAPVDTSTPVTDQVIARVALAARALAPAG